jgi:hypothetical protein
MCNLRAELRRFETHGGKTLRVRYRPIGARGDIFRIKTPIARNNSRVYIGRAVVPNSWATSMVVPGREPYYINITYLILIIFKL